MDVPEIDSGAVAELVCSSQALGIALSAKQVSQFSSYLAALLQWRQRMSLTAAADALTLVRSHVVDSLNVVPFVRPGDRVVDLGSGAGFPGVSMAIVCTDSKFGFVESRRKKANFLREVIRSVALTNADVLEERAEQVGEIGEPAYDIVVSRAVWSVGDLLETSRRLLRSQGLVIAMRGPGGLDEAIKVIGFLDPEARTYTLSGGASRVLLTYRRR